MKRIHTIAAAITLALGSSALAGPVEVDFNSTQNLKGWGSFTGTAAYDNTTDKLTLNVTNTSKGALTAFAFETEAGDKAKYEGAKGSPWKNEGNKKGVINARPFGKYEGGAAIHGTWGSTAARKALAAGGSETFVFDITGSNVSTLTTADFFTGTQPQIVATFAGYKHHKPDRAGGFGTAVVPQSITTITPGGSTVPPTGTKSSDPTIPGGPLKLPPSTPPGIKGGPSAVPLPAAAPAGFAMLALFAIGGIYRKVRTVIG